MTVPPRSVFAAAARAEVERHDEWDAPHCFQSLHLDGDKLACRTYACIMPDVNPPDYPVLMAKMADAQHDENPRDPAYAYLLQVESFGVTEPGPEASAKELADFHAARLGRTWAAEGGHGGWLTVAHWVNWGAYACLAVVWGCAGVLWLRKRRRSA